MSFLRCTDPSNVNNFTVLSKGNVGIYADIDGVARLFSPLRKVGTGIVESGQTQKIPDYWENPHVFLFPQKIKTYDGQAKGISQKIEIAEPSLSVQGDSSYRYGLSTVVLLKSENETCGIPESISMRATAASSREYEFGPFFCPGIKSASAVFSVIDYRIYYKGAGKYGKYNRKVEIKMGICDTSDGSYTWDRTISDSSHSYSPRNINISGSWVTARSYLKIHVRAYNTGGTASISLDCPSLANPHHSDIFALRVTTAEKVISSGGSCNFVVVGD